ncbi:MAG: Arm DNA-binding domain-containing protein [Thiolinea sp.]
MARNGSGVKAATKSSIEITFMYKGVRCRERIPLSPTPENLKKVLKHKNKIMEAIEEGVFDYAQTFPKSTRAKHFMSPEQLKGTVTLRDYLEDWLKQKQTVLSSSTREGYIKIFNGHIYPAFGDMPIKDITRPLIRQWISKHAVSNKTIANRLSPLRAALQDAMYDGFIEFNPLYEWTWRNKEIKKQKSQLDPFNKEEQLAIINSAQGQAKNMAQFWFWTGLRPSELMALEWSDFNQVQGTLTINKARTSASTVSEPTKTASGTRLLKLLPPALDALKQQMAFTYLRQQEIFQNPKSSERWESDKQIRSQWKPLLKIAGVRYRYPYQLRHTFASMMISSGENVRWLSKYLGHADLSTTMRVYAMWLDDADSEAGMKAFAIYGEKAE